MASVRRRTPTKAGAEPRPMSKWNVAAAVALVLAAPVACLQAQVNSGGDAPRWVRDWNGFRMAEAARGRLSGDPENPQAGVSVDPGAPALARAAYAREPLATNALFVLALADSPLTEQYQAGPAATLGARIDKRNAMLQLLLIADAARREAYPEMFGHADVLAAVHPVLARTVLMPLFEQLGNPAAVPIVETALENNARWAAAFKSYVPTDEAALRNYLALRRQAPAGERWESDEKLVGALATRGMYDEAFETWRIVTGAEQEPFAFRTDDRYAPVGWQLAAQGDRFARVDGNGTMTVSVTRGTGGELGRQLLKLSPGRYRLETRISGAEANPPLWVQLRCATAKDAPSQPLKGKIEFVVTEAGCPAHWLVIGASALEARYGVEAQVADWRFSRVS